MDEGERRKEREMKGKREKKRERRKKGKKRKVEDERKRGEKENKFEFRSFQIALSLSVA